MRWAFSFWLPTQAMKSVPSGTAYAVRSAIGAVGTAVVGLKVVSDSKAKAGAPA